MPQQSVPVGPIGLTAPGNAGIYYFLEFCLFIFYYYFKNCAFYFIVFDIDKSESSRYELLISVSSFNVLEFRLRLTRKSKYIKMCPLLSFY